MVRHHRRRSRTRAVTGEWVCCLPLGRSEHDNADDHRKGAENHPMGDTHVLDAIRHGGPESAQVDLEMVLNVMLHSACILSLSLLFWRASKHRFRKQGLWITNRFGLKKAGTSQESRMIVRNDRYKRFTTWRETAGRGAWRTISLLSSGWVKNAKNVENCGFELP